MPRLIRPLVLSSLALAGVVFVANCTEEEAPKPVWAPGTVYETVRGPNARGLLDRRGLVHAHSVYSHDACDGTPETNGVRDPICFDDFRRDLCTVKHDFVFLTDHGTSFSDTEFPEVLLYRAERGDKLIERNGGPVASRSACPDGRTALIMAGTETGTMPVGLEGHVGTPETRDDIYSRRDAEAIGLLKAQGAVSLVPHTEDWTVEQLTTMPLDGFEMYNLHANTVRAAGPVFELIGKLIAKDPNFVWGHPDLTFLSIFSEDPIYLERWGAVLSSGTKRVTTMGSDCHRNTFTQLLSDGERVDSYRRMMGWFSNHLLVKPAEDGSFDDRSLKEALGKGRLYGAFEVMGFPVGFDFHASNAAGVTEMGDEVTLASAPELKVVRPALQDLNTKRTPPAITIRLLRAVEKGFEEVASGPDSLTFKPTVAGAYRAEVRIVPHHLREDLGDDAEKLLARDFVWIYSNAIYVR